MTAQPPGPGGAVRLMAPAKLTRSLRVVGVGADGYHRLESEMVSVDLADELWVVPGADGLAVSRLPLVPGAPPAGPGLDAGPDNLVLRALRAAGRRAAVDLRKRIPVGGGLGGGSSDAAAVLRWAGVTDPAVAAGLGSDVPFCVVGGRALVTGTGEQVRPLPFEPRAFTLLLPPFGVDTGAVYRAFDAGHRGRGPEGNDLAAAALAVEPRLRPWGEALAAASGRRPSLAGSGSTWFVEGDPAALGLSGTGGLAVGGRWAPLVGVRAVPAGWEGGPAGGAG